MPTEALLTDLPDGYTASPPTKDDIEELVDLVSAIQMRGKGYATIDAEAVIASAIGVGAWTRRQVVVRNGAGQVVAWPVVHDRAAGRTMIDIDVHPEVENSDQLAASIMQWVKDNSRQLAVLRGLNETQLDATIYASDKRYRRWLIENNFDKVRTMSHLRRPVEPHEATDEKFQVNRDDLRVRPVRVHEEGMPYAEDIQAVHHMLEDSFSDHFNSHRESFPEFVQRLREDPGHRWDHWWLAEVEQDDTWIPAGALVSSYMAPDKDGKEGVYIDYVGTSRAARGMGAGKGLLYSVIRAAAERGCNRIDLEVDTESPTKANEIYQSMGWREKYVTESWHKDIAADPRILPSYMNGSERDSFIEWLEYYRGTVPLKIDGLTGVQLVQHSVPPSNLTLLGLVRHLTEVERYWFGQIVGGTKVDDLYCSPDNMDGDYDDISADDADTDVATYYKTVAEARDAIKGVMDLTEPLPGLRRGKSVNLRWVMTHVITEYARHLGHADLLRETIDGRTGR